MASIQSKISKTGKKSFYVVVSLLGKRKWIKAGTLKEAKLLKKQVESLAELERKERLGISAKSKRIDEAFQEFLDNTRLRTAPSTVKRYRAALNIFLTFLGMKYPRLKYISQITPEVIESYQRTRLESEELKLACESENKFSRKRKLLPQPQTINYEVSVLRSVFVWAQDRQWIASVPTSRVKPLRAVAKKRAQILSEKDCRLFLKTAQEMAESKQVYINGIGQEYTISFTHHENGSVDSVYYFDLDADSTIEIKRDYYSYGSERGISEFTATGSVTPGFSYNPNGSLKKLEYGDMSTKLEINYEYDNYGRITKEYIGNNISHGFRRAYHYDGSNLQKSIIASYEGRETSDTALFYRYDKASRLDSCRSYIFSKSYEYVYDKNGNRDSVYINGTGADYSYYSNTNKLKDTTTSGTLYYYDANGSIVKRADGLDTLHYDYRGLITLMSNKTSDRDTNGLYLYDTLQCYYDYDGRRVKTVYKYHSKHGCDDYEPPGDPGIDGMILGGGGNPPPPEDSCWFTWTVETYYYYYGKSVMALKRKVINPGESLHDVGNEYFIYGAGKQLCQINQDSAGARKRLFVVSDYQGNVRNLVENDNNAPSVTREYLYGPFGTLDSTWASADTLEARFGYGLKEMDREFGVGLQYHGARFYEPIVGRFTSVDPIYDYHNPYTYCRNNPIKYIDPSGMAVVKPIGERPIPTPSNSVFSLGKSLYELPGPMITYVQEFQMEARITNAVTTANWLATRERELIKQQMQEQEDNESTGTGGNEAKDSYFHGLFLSEEAAATHFGMNYNDDSIREDVEYASFIYEVNIMGMKFYWYSGPVKGSAHYVEAGEPMKGMRLTGFIHTHGKYNSDPGVANDRFSGSSCQ